MKKDSLIYLQDILQSINKIEKYVAGVNYEQFVEDEMRPDMMK